MDPTQPTGPAIAAAVYALPYVLDTLERIEKTARDAAEAFTERNAHGYALDAHVQAVQAHEAAGWLRPAVDALRTHPGAGPCSAAGVIVRLNTAEDLEALAGIVGLDVAVTLSDNPTGHPNPDHPQAARFEVRSLTAVESVTDDDGVGFPWITAAHGAAMWHDVVAIELRSAVDRDEAAHAARLRRLADDLLDAYVDAHDHLPDEDGA
jgi:hypothetical protein